MKNFKILTLGASGAGKTVFLASMFKQLSIQKNSTFKLEVDNPQQRKLLNSTYTHLITGDSWPLGTKNISEWTFNCCVQTENLDNYTVCQFTYYDYAGGRLTDSDEDSDEDSDFEEVVKQADVILGLLDGYKIHAWLTGNNESLVNTFLKVDLPSIIKRMHISSAPIHFVISKWDIFGKKFPLSQVFSKLRTIPEFDNLIASRNSIASPVRFIPVSSVGFDYAILQPDGSMKKNPGAIPSPWLVQYPIACVFPDKLKQLIKEAQAKQKQIEEQGKENNAWLDTLASFSDVLGLGLTSFGVILNFLGNEELQMIKNVTRVASFTNGFLKNGVLGIMGKKAQNKREEALNAVKDEKSALQHAMSVFHDFERELTVIFPDSRLV